MQLRSYRLAFLVIPLLHKNFLATVEQLSPGAAESMREMARSLS